MYEQNEPMRVKIAKAQAAKIPFMLVVGDKEIEDGTVSLRTREEGDKGSVPVADVIGAIADARVK